MVPPGTSRVNQVLRWKKCLPEPHSGLRYHRQIDDVRPQGPTRALLPLRRRRELRTISKPTRLLPTPDGQVSSRVGTWYGMLSMDPHRESSLDDGAVAKNGQEAPRRCFVVNCTARCAGESSHTRYRLAAFL